MYFNSRTAGTLKYDPLFAIATPCNNFSVTAAKILLGNTLSVRMGQTHEHIRTHS